MESKIPCFTSLAKALSTLYGNDVRLAKSFHVPGGDINKAYGIQLVNGEILFMKANEKSNLDFFEKESLNIQAIANTKTISTPKLLALGTDNGEEVGYSFLLMKFVELGDLDEKFWERFAADLSDMHKADTESFIPKNDFQNGKKFGFLQDNYIGKTKQINTPKETWLDFFRENRLEYQFKLAEKHFSSDDFKKINKLLDNLSSFLIEPEKPALLHGDLWGGNVMCNKKSRAMLIDPACYVGHPEADIAMTELFGGFSGKFYDAYKQTGLIQPEYSERRDLYNLYHLLNHLNMFGATYLSAVQSVIDKYVG